jgi:hypothetical protein
MRCNNTDDKINKKFIGHAADTFQPTETLRFSGLGRWTFRLAQ